MGNTDCKKKYELRLNHADSALGICKKQLSTFVKGSHVGIFLAYHLIKRLLCSTYPYLGMLYALVGNRANTKLTVIIHHPHPLCAKLG